LLDREALEMKATMEKALKDREKAQQASFKMAWEAQ
jgi:hypothetical protein